MAVTQTASLFTMVNKLAEIKGLVGDVDATENPMAFYDYIVEAMKGRPVDDSFRRDLEGFRHNIEWSLYLNRFVVATFEGSPDADLNLTSMRFTCAKDKDGNQRAETNAAKVILKAFETGNFEGGREAYRKVLRNQLNTGINRKVKKLATANIEEQIGETRETQFLKGLEIYRSGEGRAARNREMERAESWRLQWLGYSLRDMVLPPSDLNAPTLELWDQILESARAVVEEDRQANRLPTSLSGSPDERYAVDTGLFKWSVDRMIFGQKVPELTGIDQINDGFPMNENHWYYRTSTPVWAFWTIKRELGYKQYLTKSTASQISDRLREIVELPDYDHVEQLTSLINTSTITEINTRDCYARDILCETLMD